MDDIIAGSAFSLGRRDCASDALRNVFQRKNCEFPFLRIWFSSLVTAGRAATLPVSRSGPRLPQPEKFCGSHDARRVEDFLDEAFLWLLTANITVAHRAIWGSFLLTADAKPFLTSKLADLHTRNGVTLPTMTWDQFRSIMIEGHCKPELNISARAALHALRQDRLSVEDSSCCGCS